MGLMFRPLPWLTVSSLAALALLLWLGAWQWEKFVAKQNAPPTQVLAITGRIDPQRTVFVHAVLEGVAGWRVFTPVLGDEGGLADVAFLPGLQPPAPGLAAAAASQSATPLRGAWATPRRPNPFLPPARPEQGVFYGVELPGMAQALGLEQAPARYFAAEYAGAPNPFLHTGTTPERHLGYALTWWGLAGGLGGVYAAMHWSRGRLRLKRGGM